MLDTLNAERSRLQVEPQELQRTRNQRRTKRMIDHRQLPMPAWARYILSTATVVDIGTLQWLAFLQ